MHGDRAAGGSRTGCRRCGLAIEAKGSCVLEAFPIACLPSCARPVLLYRLPELMMSDAEASGSTAPKPTVQFFKKARGRPQSSRKRSVSPEKPSAEDASSLASAPAAASAVIRPTSKATFTTPTVQGTKRLREDREKDRQKSEMEYRASEALKGISEQADFVTRSAD